MRIVFMGTPAAAVPTLARVIDDGHEVVAVYTQPDKPAGRGNKVSPSPVKTFAVEKGIEVFQPVKIRTPEALEVFHSHAADVAVVVAYGRILPEPFLTAFPMGAVNVHFSLLPKYRGAAPVNWAIVNGEARTGVTTMKMDAGLDTGDILLRKATEIGETETAPELMARLAVVGAELLSRTLREFKSIAPEPQNVAEATLAPILRKSDGLIDWSMDARSIADRVRGFQPFPGTFSILRGVGVKIWKAAAADGAAGRAGEVLAASGDELKVACGNGSVLSIEELQPEGKKRMKARDFINGLRPVVGERFGGENN